MSLPEYRKSEQLIDATLENTTDYRFMFLNNMDGADDEDKIHLVRAIELPEGFEYKIAQPKQQERRKRPAIQW